MSIEDTLYLEVQNTCPLCGNRGRYNLSKHHIDGNRDDNSYENLIIICNHCHTKYNQGHIRDNEIVSCKQTLIKQTLTQYGINALKISYRNNYGVVANPYLLYHLVELGYMVKGATHSSYLDATNEVEIDAIFTITEQGKRLYETWLKNL